MAEAAKVTLDYKAPLAAAIMVLMVVMMVFDFIPVEPVTAVLIASMLMILTRCFRNVEAAYKAINWESIFLIGGYEAYYGYRWFDADVACFGKDRCVGTDFRFVG